VKTTAGGLASAQWTLGVTGTQAVTVALSSFPTPPVVVTANTSTAIVQALVSPKPDTLVAIGAMQQMTVQGLNASSQPVIGTWTWVSRDPAVATVSASGLVTAASNGSTYIVATESGGAKDSSPTVVRQRIANINVTPANRALYVGGLFNYTAQAVDANNVALATQPAFAWTSTSSQAASVNAVTGAVQALSVGSTQINASSGGAVGTASLTVKPSITAIRVSYDSAGAPAPDIATVASLGAGRSYRAIALDTLGAVMSGVTFAWSVGNPSAAQLDVVQPDRAHAVAVANGTTGISATAQGIRGEASLRVVQALAAIDLQPADVTVAVNGSRQLTARGKDANGFPVSGSAFSFSSSAPNKVSVGANSGLVTGVALGSANITASSGAITSNVAVVKVDNSAPGSSP
jgi:uncharacterized protein YjdB